MKVRILFLAAMAAVLFLGGCSFTDKTQDVVLQDTFIENLQVEYMSNPLGIDEETPLFSWKMSSSVRGQKQTAYRIMAADSMESLAEEKLVWDSGRTEGSESVAIPYGGLPLEASQRYFWKVQVWDKEGMLLENTEPAYFETGLMGSGWSDAKWLSRPIPDKDKKPAADDCNYTINFNLFLNNTTAGLIWGADTHEYGEYYVGALSAGEQEVWFTTFAVNEYIKSEEQRFEATDIISVEELKKDGVSVQIAVNGDRAVTSLNGTEVCAVQLKEAKPVGRIGLYKDRTTEKAYIDDLYICSDDGEVLLQENFESEETVFSPEYIKFNDGRACIPAGLQLIPGKDDPAPMFQRNFELSEKKIRKASLYASALGIYQLFINGERIADTFFDPGQTVYHDELVYCTYDVTSFLHNGPNAVGAMLGHGWFDRAVGGLGGWNSWGHCGPAFLGKLVVTYEDGSQDVIVTDENWKLWDDGPVRRDDMYQGEFYDSRYESDAFAAAGADLSTWKIPAVNAVDSRFLSVPVTAHERESVRQVYTMQPVNVTEPEKGTLVYDFGQEFTGVCRIRLNAQEGQCITIRYAEAVNTEELRNKDDEVGYIWTENLLTASNIDYYVGKGGGEQTYTPSFVCRGFRYVQISGLEEGQEIQAEGIVLMSALEETGSFECSDPFLTRLYHNIFWSQRSNFVDIPSDCPQRDERFGWSGDIAQFSSTAVYNLDCRNFLKKYLDWMRLEQNEDGAYPDMAPRTDDQGFGRNGWGDAGVLLTWRLYQQYADISILEENFEAMCAWIDYLEAVSEDYIRYCPDSYGDHLQGSSTPRDMTDTMQCAYSAQLVSKMAGILGKEQEKEHYARVAGSFRSAWQDKWLQEDGMITDGTQSAYTMALAYDLYPEHLRQAGEDWLAICVEWVDAHPMTGFVASAYILEELEKSGRSDLAYRMLMQQTAPSWNHDIKLGATTIAESWSSYVAYDDGTYGLYGSLNHYALGSVGKWFYSGILGISSDPETPGFEKLLLSPQITDKLTYAQGSYDSVKGKIEVMWEMTEKGYRYTVTVPANTSAELILPLLPGQTVYESTKAVSADYTDEHVSVLEHTPDQMRLHMESGHYDFTVELR